MRNTLLYLSLLLCCCAPALAQNTYYFPGKNFDPAVLTPEQFLGYPIGGRHTRYDKMVEYLRYLTLKSSSSAMYLEPFGETVEGREQVLLVVSSKANAGKVETLRQTHLAHTDPTQARPDAQEDFVVVWLGYNVHGNEASGGEAALLTAYYLAACTDAELQNQLSKSIVLIEPVINPDGRDRFATWVNSNRGEPVVSDPNDREHNEAWPGGRFNHYWFDLNRDWYLAQQVESRNRLKIYHKWLPNVVTDHHEMGTNATFFFEPSKENAENDLVPRTLYRSLNPRFADYFEAAMNSIGALYGTKELFDNFYPGYGSSYPDLQGGLGLLFEQASSRGHAQDSRNGVLTFSYAVRNQLVNALATITAAVGEAKTLVQYQYDFYANAVEAGKKATTKAWVVGCADDAGRNRAFRDLLLQHHIQCYHLKNTFKGPDGVTYQPGQAVIIPAEQPQYYMIRSIFDRQTAGYKDSLFYDASTWNLALAYGMKYAETGSLPERGPAIREADLGMPYPLFDKSDYAYLMPWKDYYAPQALQKLHEKGILVKVATRSFTLNMASGATLYGAGTLIIPVQIQKIPSARLFEILSDISHQTGIGFDPATTGRSAQGPDLGSVTAFTAQAPKVLMVVGAGVSAPEAGEIWHLMDNRVGLPITKVDISSLPRLNLNPYNTLIIVGGNYATLDTAFARKLKTWIGLGNTFIAMKGAVEWGIKSKMFPGERLREMRTDTSRNKPRVDFETVANIDGAKQTGGAIFEAVVDPTHPIGYGYTDRKIAIYRNNNTILERSQLPAGTVLQYTDAPLLSGYVHTQTLKRIAGSAAINVVYEGSGRSILFSNNPNFRATWYGTNKLFLNSVFFSGGIVAPGGRD